MEYSFKDAIEHRRSYYNISNSSVVSDKQIEEIINFAVKHVPSAFNSQTTRVVLLLGNNHKRLWDIVLTTLSKVVPAAAFESTEAKISSFAAGYGSVLYFEDLDVVRSLQKSFPLYADNFPTWSEQTSGMHQLTIWTMLEQAGFGASLQHYNPLIDNLVRDEWSLPQSWKLISQMPFGTPTAEPAEKTFQPLKERVLVFK